MQAALENKKQDIDTYKHFIFQVSVGKCYFLIQYCIMHFETERLT